MGVCAGSNDGYWPNPDTGPVVWYPFHMKVRKAMKFVTIALVGAAGLALLALVVVYLWVLSWCAIRGVCL